MAKPWIDLPSLRKELGQFFVDNKTDISDFGSRVNQSFEAFVFASLVNWYSQNGWSVKFKHPTPGSRFVKLKYSTRGRPSGYTYALCTKGKAKIQIRHGLRVGINHYKLEFSRPANIVLDVAVIADADLSGLKTSDHVDNSQLITFGEAKHMAAFAELIAGFVGLVHEMRPCRLAPIRSPASPLEPREHPAPFLYVSGHLNPTAQGLVESIKDRGYDIDVYDYQTGAFFGITLPIGKSNCGP